MESKDEGISIERILNESQMSLTMEPSFVGITNNDSSNFEEIFKNTFFNPAFNNICFRNFYYLEEINLYNTNNLNSIRTSNESNDA